MSLYLFYFFKKIKSTWMIWIIMVIIIIIITYEAIWMQLLFPVFQYLLFSYLLSVTKKTIIMEIFKCQILNWMCTLNFLLRFEINGIWYILLNPHGSDSLKRAYALIPDWKYDYFSVQFGKRRGISATFVWGTVWRDDKRTSC